MGTEKSKLVIIGSEEQQIFLLSVHNKILIWLKMRWYNEMVGMLQFLQTKCALFISVPSTMQVVAPPKLWSFLELQASLAL